MTPRATLATAERVLRQIRHDRRTLALLLVVPSLLLMLVAWIFSDTPVFDGIAPSLIAMFPFITMFLVTSIATLRERRSGTLERLLSMPVGKGDLIIGYALAFGLLAVVQSLVCVGVAVWVCGVDIGEHPTLLLLAAALNGVLGTSLGLFTSAFAATEFQVVQFMPVFVFPQILLAGLFVPTEDLPTGLEQLSRILPMTHSFEALAELAAPDADLSAAGAHIAVICGFTVAFLVIGSLSLRRRTA
ncbi:ABC transporter permease [Brachybacterium sp. DNPG3]